MLRLAYLVVLITSIWTFTWLDKAPRMENAPVLDLSVSILGFCAGSYCGLVRDIAHNSEIDCNAFHGLYEW